MGERKHHFMLMYVQRSHHGGYGVQDTLHSITFMQDTRAVTKRAMQDVMDADSGRHHNCKPLSVSYLGEMTAEEFLG